MKTRRKCGGINEGKIWKNIMNKKQLKTKMTGVPGWNLNTNMSTFIPNQLNNECFLLLFYNDSVIDNEILANTINPEQKADSIIIKLKTWEKADWLFELTIEINRKGRISLHISLLRIEVSYLKNISITKKNWMY